MLLVFIHIVTTYVLYMIQADMYQTMRDDYISYLFYIYSGPINNVALLPNKWQAIIWISGGLVYT